MHPNVDGVSPMHQSGNKFETRISITISHSPKGKLTEPGIQMSGRGHHFIPRHYLKRFVIPGSNDQLWMYRRGKSEPFLVARANAAKQRDFYPSELDDLITDYEQRLSVLVDQIRRLKADSLITSQEIAEVVAHLSVRTAHLRGAMENVGAVILQRLTELLQLSGTSNLGLSLPRHCPPVKFTELVADQIETSDLATQIHVSAETAARLLYQMLRENPSSVVHPFLDELLPILEQLAPIMPDLVKTGMSEGLTKSVVPQERAAQLAALSWKVVAHKHESAVLPDCVCFGRFGDEPWMPLPLVQTDDLDAVVIPLTTSTLAVGTNATAAKFDAREFNSIAMAQCFDFFLASERLDHLETFLPSLGEQIRLGISDLLDGGIRETLADFTKPPSILTHGKDASLLAVDPQVGNLGGYPVNFLGCASEAEAESISGMLGYIVSVWAKIVPLSRLDGFTFANDYEDAVSEVGLRSISKPEHSPSDNTRAKPSHAAGVGMPVTVSVDGQPKRRLVLRGFIGHDLVSTDTRMRNQAFSVVTYLLASVTFLEILDTRFPDLVGSSIDHPLEAQLYGGSQGAFEAYFATMISVVDSDSLPELELLLDEELENAVSAINRARANYLDDDDHAKLYLDVAERVSSILVAFARVLGTRSALDIPEPLSANMSEKLKRLNMLDWAKLYAQDLEAFYLELSDWQNFEEFFVFNRHFERWMVRCGLILDVLPSGDLFIRVEVDESFNLSPGD